MQGEESAARAEFLSAFERKGTVQLPDILIFVERSFDSAARALVVTVTGNVSLPTARRDQNVEMGIEIETSAEGVLHHHNQHANTISIFRPLHG